MLRVLPEKNKIVVEGVNRVYKHLKPSAKNQQGGRLSKEMPIDVSNVMLYCPSCNRGVRVGHRFTDEGRKQRYCKSCSTALGDRRPGQARQGDQEELERLLFKVIATFPIMLGSGPSPGRDGEGDVPWLA